MGVRELDIPGAWEITPAVHGDSRGLFFEWLTDRGFTAFAGHHLDVRQANCSVSSAGVLRGLHFAQLPPSQAKYVTCVHGSVFDVVVDIRVGSPTFGRWDSVLLDDKDHRTIYISEGLGHGVLVLGGIQPAARAHHLCDRSDPCDRLAARRRSRPKLVRPRCRGPQPRRSARVRALADVGADAEVYRRYAQQIAGRPYILLDKIRRRRGLKPIKGESGEA
jgi:dTDP-4-dehydrorhamnose 3,5-epimerase